MASRTLATVILNGAPPLRPRARAQASPALVRSEIGSRSNSAFCGAPQKSEFIQPRIASGCMKLPALRSLGELADLATGGRDRFQGAAASGVYAPAAAAAIAVNGLLIASA
jgi:hypothetical protein